MKNSHLQMEGLKKNLLKGKEKFLKYCILGSILSLIWVLGTFRDKSILIRNEL